jgi:hypothetical protein
MSKVFASVFFMVTLFTAAQAQAQDQNSSQLSPSFGPHFIYSKDGKETLKLTPETAPLNGDVYILVDRCDGQRSHCAPLVPGHELLSKDELTDQLTNRDVKSDIWQFSFGAAGVAGLLARHAVVAALTPILGPTVGPWVAGTAAAVGLAGIGYKEFKSFYHGDQLGTVETMAGAGPYEPSDSRVYSVGSYEKELTQVIDKQTQDEAKSSSQAQAAR